MTLILHMTKRRKEFSVACNGKGLSTNRLPGADLVLFTCSHQTIHSKIRKFPSKIDSGLFTKITGSPPKYLGVCSTNSLATRRGTRNLIYLLPLLFLISLQLLVTNFLSSTNFSNFTLLLLLVQV